MPPGSLDFFVAVVEMGAINGRPVAELPRIDSSGRSGSSTSSYALAATSAQPSVIDSRSFATLSGSRSACSSIARGGSEKCHGRACCQRVGQRGRRATRDRSSRCRQDRHRPDKSACAPVSIIPTPGQPVARCWRGRPRAPGPRRRQAFPAEGVMVQCIGVAHAGRQIPQKPGGQAQGVKILHDAGGIPR